MIASLARFIDWLFIQQGFRRLPPINEQTLRLEEAIQFATAANFIPTESRLYRCGAQWEKRPAVILLHGGNLMRGGKDSIGYRFRQPLTAHVSKSLVPGLIPRVIGWLTPPLNKVAQPVSRRA